MGDFVRRFGRRYDGDACCIAEAVFRILLFPPANICTASGHHVFQEFHFRIFHLQIDHVDPCRVLLAKDIFYVCVFIGLVLSLISMEDRRNTAKEMVCMEPHPSLVQYTLLFQRGGRLAHLRCLRVVRACVHGVRAFAWPGWRPIRLCVGEFVCPCADSSRRPCTCASVFRRRG